MQNQSRKDLSLSTVRMGDSGWGARANADEMIIWHDMRRSLTWQPVSGFHLLTPETGSRKKLKRCTHSVIYEKCHLYTIYNRPNNNRLTVVCECDWRRFDKKNKIPLTCHSNTETAIMLWSDKWNVSIRSLFIRLLIASMHTMIHHTCGIYSYRPTFFLGRGEPSLAEKYFDSTRKNCLHQIACYQQGTMTLYKWIVIIITETFHCR